MNIRNQKELCRFASQRLENAPLSGKITVIYAVVLIGLSVLSSLGSYVLGIAIDQSGGLSNMGTRTMLSALQTMLPLIQSAIAMCIDLGYIAAMLRIARGQYVSPQTLRLGFDRFWVLLRYTILETMLFSSMALGCAYFGVVLFLLSPLSAGVMELLVPLVQDASVLSGTIHIPDEVYASVIKGMIPAYLICGILFCVFGIPLYYRLRMSRYVLIDKPGLGALAAMQESRKMMKHNALNLFKLDLHMWWYYLATIAASVLCYGDQLLLLAGIELPFHEDVNYFLFYGLYWVAQFAIFYFLLPKVAVSYALAYDAVCPKEEPAKGVVLGNIFQM